MPPLPNSITVEISSSFGIDLWVGKMPWRRKWLPTSVILLGKPMDRGVWWATVHRAAKSQTRMKRLGTHALCKTAQRFLRKLKMELPNDPAVPLPGTYPCKTLTKKDTSLPWWSTLPMRGLGSIPGQGTGSHRLQLEIPHATAQTEDPTCHN